MQPRSSGTRVKWPSVIHSLRVHHTPTRCIDSGGWVVDAKVLSGSTKIAHNFGICTTDLELCKMILSTELRIRPPGRTRTEKSSMIWYTIIVLYVFVKIQRGQEPLKWRGCDWFNELQCNDITVRTSSSTAQWTTLADTIKKAYVIMISSSIETLFCILILKE